MAESFSVSLDEVGVTGSTVEVAATIESHGHYHGHVSYSVTYEPGPESPNNITPTAGSKYVPKDDSVVVSIFVTITGTCRLIVTVWDTQDTIEEDLIVSTSFQTARK